jgi:hypothetical protein
MFPVVALGDLMISLQLPQGSLVQPSRGQWDFKGDKMPAV